MPNSKHPVISRPKSLFLRQCLTRSGQPVRMGKNQNKSVLSLFFFNRNSQAHILNGVAFCSTTAEKDTEENIIKA